MAARAAAERAATPAAISHLHLRRGFSSLALRALQRSCLRLRRFPNHPCALKVRRARALQRLLRHLAARLSLSDICGGAGGAGGSLRTRSAGGPTYRRGPRPNLSRSAATTGRRLPPTFPTTIAIPNSANTTASPSRTSDGPTGAYR